MNKCQTYEAKIYCGLKEGYNGKELSLSEVFNVCREYVNNVGLAVTISSCAFVYSGDGVEQGACVGLINYPRFPSTPEHIKTTAIALAQKLKDHLKQERVTIVCTDETIMLGEM